MGTESKNFRIECLYNECLLMSISNALANAGVAGGTGPTGPRGQNGPPTIRSAGPPITPGTTPGDIYYDTLNNLFYNWNGAAWVLVKNGSAGPTGSRGPIGPGKAGAGVPILPGSAVGETYVNTLTNDIYFWNGFMWTVLSISSSGTGPAGASGSTGLIGPTTLGVGPPGAAGAVGEMYIDTLTNTLYYYNGVVWTIVSGGGAGVLGSTGSTGPAATAGITGPQGNAGGAGTDGAQGPTGPAAVSSLTGATGPGGAGASPTGATGIRGPTGTQGPTGPNLVVNTSGPVTGDGSVALPVTLKPGIDCGILQFLNGAWRNSPFPGITMVTVGGLTALPMFPTVQAALDNGCKYIRIIEQTTDNNLVIPDADVLVFIDGYPLNTVPIPPYVRWILTGNSVALNGSLTIRGQQGNQTDNLEIKTNSTPFFTGTSANTLFLKNILVDLTTRVVNTVLYSTAITTRIEDCYIAIPSAGDCFIGPAGSIISDTIIQNTKIGTLTGGFTTTSFNIIMGDTTGGSLLIKNISFLGSVQYSGVLYDVSGPNQNVDGVICNAIGNVNSGELILRGGGTISNTAGCGKITAFGTPGTMTLINNINTTSNSGLGNIGDIEVQGSNIILSNACVKLLNIPNPLTNSVIENLTGNISVGNVATIDGCILRNITAPAGAGSVIINRIQNSSLDNFNGDPGFAGLAIATVSIFGQEGLVANCNFSNIRVSGLFVGQTSPGTDQVIRITRSNFKNITVTDPAVTNNIINCCQNCTFSNIKVLSRLNISACTQVSFANIYVDTLLSNVSGITNGAAFEAMNDCSFKNMVINDIFLNGGLNDFNIISPYSFLRFENLKINLSNRRIVVANTVVKDTIVSFTSTQIGSNSGGGTGKIIGAAGNPATLPMVTNVITEVAETLGTDINNTGSYAPFPSAPISSISFIVW